MKAATNYRLLRLLMTAALGTLLSIGAASGQQGAGFSFGDAAGTNAACLTCHGNATAVKGGSFIDQSQFAHTTHSLIGCSACHDAVTQGHPDGSRTPRASCQQCHAEINTEYSQSIHGGKAACSGCHNPHQVATPKEISGQQINQICAGCHDGFKMVAKHGEWLPQAELHINMLPCITCHTGSKNYFVSMYIIKGKDDPRLKPEVASYQELKKQAGVRGILSLIDTNGDNYVSLTELRNFNKDPSHKQLRLKGMLTPETVTHKFEILDNRRNCTFCHGSGPTVMQTSYLTLPQEDGTYTRIAVEKGAVLDALYGTPDFYLMGSSKSNTLNYIGLAIICGGLILPVGHGSLRFLTRKNRKEKEHKS